MEVLDGHFLVDDIDSGCSSDGAQWEWEDIVDPIGPAELKGEGKLPHDMTKDENVANWQDVNQAKVKEIKGLHDLGCFQRYPRAKAETSLMLGG